MHKSYVCPYCELTVCVPYLLPDWWDGGYGQEEFPLIDAIDCPGCGYPYELTIEFPSTLNNINNNNTHTNKNNNGR